MAKPKKLEKVGYVCCVVSTPEGYKALIPGMVKDGEKYFPVNVSHLPEGTPIEQWRADVQKEINTIVAEAQSPKLDQLQASLKQRLSANSHYDVYDVMVNKLLPPSPPF